MDCSSRTFNHALAAHAALGVIDVSQEILDCNGLERTGLCAFSAADAGGQAGLPCYGTLVLITASHINPSALRTLVAEFYDLLRASLYAGAAGSTFLFVNFRKTSVRVDFDSIELADSFAVAPAETSEPAVGIAAVQ